MAARAFWATLASLVLLVGGVRAPVLGDTPADRTKAVAVEVRLVRVPEALWEKIGKKLEVEKSPVMSERELFLFLTAVQDDPRTTITQAPKVTLMDGGTSRLSCRGRVYQLDGKDPNGDWSLAINPKVSSTGKSVKLCLKGDLSAAAGTEVKLKKTLRITEGGTALLGGWKVPAVTADERARIPILSTLPYFCSLYEREQAKRQTDRLLLLVTPHVLPDPATNHESHE